MSHDGGSPEATASNRVNLQERLEALFASKPNPATGKRYTGPQVEAAVRELVERLPPEEQPGRGISATYVWQLLNGKRTNPTLKHLQSLADVFGVPVTYFVDDDATVDSLKEMAELSRLAEASGVRDILFRAVGTDETTLRLVRDLLDYANDRKSSRDGDHP
jgi:hypothetical protein